MISFRNFLRATRGFPTFFIGEKITETCSISAKTNVILYPIINTDLVPLYRRISISSKNIQIKQQTSCVSKLDGTYNCFELLSSKFSHSDIWAWGVFLTFSFFFKVAKAWPLGLFFADEKTLTKLKILLGLCNFFFSTD